MPPFICIAAVFLAFMFCFPKGISLNCHYCESYGSSTECLKTSDKICEPGQDMCKIQTTWRGNLYNDMTIVKSCSTSTECPSANQTTPTCYKYESSWFCTLCCKENLCNIGANGEVPRPPPYPPVPNPLIQRLTRDCGEEKEMCTTALRWSEHDNVQIDKHCTTSSGQFEDNLLNRVNKCNIPSDPGYCVTCCQDDDCISPAVPASAADQRNYRQTLLVVICSLTKWISWPGE